MNQLKVVFINLFITVFLVEIILRIFWSNHYIPSYEDAYFHKPNIEIFFNKIEKLYDYNKTISFRTSEYGNIISESDEAHNFKSFAIALGGSSTESALVQEGKRWPDLINIPTMNFGRSSLNSSHTIKNLEYIINIYGLRPNKLFIMDGVNNLHNYLEFGESGLYSPEINFNRSFYKSILRNYYTSAYFFSLIKRSDYYLFYKLDVERRKLLPEISDKELEIFWKQNREQMYNSLKWAFNKIKNTSSNNNIEVHILTQPHAYNKNYKVYNDDLRVTPIINNKQLTIAQAERLMRDYNDLTILVANNLNIKSLDIAECFENTNVSKLLYDSFHFTLKGSEFFSSCLNSKL